MKKFILSVCAALMLFCGGASAKVSILKSSMASVTGGNVEYDAASGQFEWKAAWANLVTMFDNLQGQASKYKHLKLKIANPSGEYRLIFYTDLKADKKVQKVMNASDTDVEIDLSTLDLEGKTLDDIARISIAGQGDGGSLTVLPADVTLETDDIETLTVTTTLDETSDVYAPFQWYKTTDSGAEAITNEISNNFGKSEWDGSVLFGYSLDNKEINGYINLNGYSVLRVNINEFDSSKKTKFRALDRNGNTEYINMTGNETLVSFSLDRCTSLKDDWGDAGAQNFTSIDFIGEYQADNTVSPFAIAASKGSKISYDRNFTQDQPSTICLPFALTAEELAKVGKAYTLSAVNGSTATFTPVTAIEAYTPYLLIPSASGKLLKNIGATKDITAVPAEAKTSVSGSYSFVGTLQAKKSVKTPNTEVYGFSADGGKFVRVGENASIDAFRAYIAVPTTALSTAASRSIDIDFGGTTGINEIQNAQSSSAAATYDVAGKRVGKNYKGVVICNGKKMIQK
ncbi:MAG: hypothetical protein UCO54_08635 [Segatella copri]|nr:hypothetical protein [Segatella copri]